MKKHIAFFLVAGLFIIAACQKEASFENGTKPSAGTLKDDVTGDCLPKNVVGTYEVGKVLVGTVNYMEVDVDVSITGNYTIYSDTVNGVYFRSVGLFTGLGTKTVRLGSVGTPFAAGDFNFRVQYDGQECFVPVTFVPNGSGSPAVFTLAGAPTACTPFVVNGTYAVGTPLNSSNTATINVNVTTIGTYTITTAATNGMTFSKTGVFASTGTNIPVTLVGGGSPTAAGTNQVPVTVGTSTCTFPVTTVAAAAFSVNCGTAVLAGTYTAGVALTSANTVTLDVNVTTPGAYSVSTTPVNGITFTGSGTLVAGPQTIVLTGTGTPTTSGSIIVTVAATPACTFTLPVSPGVSVVDWKFTLGPTPSTLYQGTVSNFTLAPLGPFLSMIYLGQGSNSGESFALSLIDANGTIANGETYSSSSSTTNSAGFDFGITSPTMDEFKADPSITGVTLTVTVTTNNTTTKTITGTFSGTVKNNAGAVKTVSGGTFTGVYL
jgi:hypothetical protein